MLAIIAVYFFCVGAVLFDLGMLQVHTEGGSLVETVLEQTKRNPVPCLGKFWQLEEFNIFMNHKYCSLINLHAEL